MIITWMLWKLGWVLLFLPLAPHVWLFLARRQSMKEFKISRLEAMLDAYVPESENVLYVFKASRLYFWFLVFACVAGAAAYEMTLIHFLRGREFTIHNVKFILAALVLLPMAATYYLNATLTVLVITDQRVCVRNLATGFQARVIPMSQVQTLEAAIPLGYRKTRVALKDGTFVNLLRPKNLADFKAAKEALGL